MNIYRKFQDVLMGLTVNSVWLILTVAAGYLVYRWNDMNPFFLMCYVSIAAFVIISILEVGKTMQRSINLANFDIIELPGVLRNKKTGDICCYKCGLQKIESYHIVDLEKGYMCRNCGDVIFSFDKWQDFMEFRKEWELDKNQQSRKKTERMTRSP